MKLFLLLNQVFGSSLLFGTDLQDCGGEGTTCINVSRPNGSLVCMQVNEAAKSIWSSLESYESEFKCMCVHSYNWVVYNKNADIQILAAGTHECAYNFISGEANTIEDGQLTNDALTD